MAAGFCLDSNQEVRKDFKKMLQIIDLGICLKPIKRDYYNKKFIGLYPQIYRLYAVANSDLNNMIEFHRQNNRFRIYYNNYHENIRGDNMGI